MKYIAALILVAMATFGSCEYTEMLELTPAVASDSVCDVSLWCKDYATAARCEKVAYCQKWIWGEVPTSEECNLCMRVLNENATVINEICSTFPFSLAEGKCKSWLHSYVDKYTSQEVCHDMGFCSQTEGVAVESEPALDVCADCKEFANLLLKNADTIKKLLDSVCKKTPVDPMCEALVDYVINLIESDNATYICQKIGLCNKVSHRLLGADGCTWGPGYWCASLDNAKECEAIDYCNKKYWK